MPNARSYFAFLILSFPTEVPTMFVQLTPRRSPFAMRRSPHQLISGRDEPVPGIELLKGLAFDAGNERRNQPLRLAHLDDSDDCAILLESGEGPARVKMTMLRHGELHR